MQIQETIWSHYHDLGNSALAAKHLDVAEKMFAAAAEEARRTTIKPQLLADSWFGMAQTLHNRKQNDLAAHFYKKAAAVYEEEPRKRMKLAACWDNLAALWLDRGDLNKSKMFYRKSIAVYENVLGANAPEISPRLMRLGYIYSQVKLFDEALACYQRAKSIAIASSRQDGSPISMTSRPDISGSIAKPADAHDIESTLTNKSPFVATLPDEHPCKEPPPAVPITSTPLNNAIGIQTTFTFTP